MLPKFCVAEIKIPDSTTNKRKKLIKLYLKISRNKLKKKNASKSTYLKERREVSERDREERGADREREREERGGEREDSE